VEIFAAQGAPPQSLTPVWQMEKIFFQKTFNYFIWTLAANFQPVSLTPVVATAVSTTPAVLVAKFAAGVVDNSGAP
jgi:hypothetical protein